MEKWKDWEPLGRDIPDGKTLRKMLIDIEMSQQQIAIETGMPEPTISNALNGRRHLDKARLYLSLYFAEKMQQPLPNRMFTQPLTTR